MARVILFPALGRNLPHWPYDLGRSPLFFTVNSGVHPSWILPSLSFFLLQSIVFRPSASFAYMQLAPWHYDRFIPSILLILYFPFLIPRRELASELERCPQWKSASELERCPQWKSASELERCPQWKSASELERCPPPPRENRLTNWSVTEFNEKSRPRITKPAAAPIGRPVNELERYGIKEIENGGPPHGRSLSGRVRP